MLPGPIQYTPIAERFCANAELTLSLLRDHGPAPVFGQLKRQRFSCSIVEIFMPVCAQDRGSDTLLKLRELAENR